MKTPPKNLQEKAPKSNIYGFDIDEWNTSRKPVKLTENMNLFDMELPQKKPLNYPKTQHSKRSINTSTQVALIIF